MQGQRLWRGLSAAEPCRTAELLGAWSSVGVSCYLRVWLQREGVGSVSFQQACLAPCLAEPPAEPQAQGLLERATHATCMSMVQETGEGEPHSAAGSALFWVEEAGIVAPGAGLKARSARAAPDC